MLNGNVPNKKTCVKNWINIQKIQVNIQDFAKKSISWIFNSISLNLYHTGSFIWGITFHNLKYLDKLIKCLEMRAEIKPVRKINKIFLCIFTYIWKSDIFSTYLNFDEKWFFGHFKSQISKCPNHIRILPHVLRHRKPSGQFNKQKLLYNHSWTPCSILIILLHMLLNGIEMY